MVSYPLFMTVLTLATAIGLYVGLLVFADFKNLGESRIKRGIMHNWKFVILLAVILLLILIENATHDLVYGAINADFTPLIYSMSFQGAVGYGIQTALRSGFLDVSLTVIYIYFYTYILFFTPLMYMVRDDRLRMKQYTLALLLTFAVLMPFYFLFAVQTPSMSGLVTTEAILYSNPNLLEMVKMVDPLDNCFPSGHIAVPFVVFFLLLPFNRHRQYLRYAYFMGILSFLISFAVLYLGAHWLIDILSAILLAWLIVWFVKKKWFMAWFDRNVPRFVAAFKKN